MPDLARERERLEHVLEHAWLIPEADLGKVKPGDLPLIKNWLASAPIHPLLTRCEEERVDPAKHFLRLIRNPDYFPFTCKAVFNIDILPFQHLILKELWIRPFPMLIATRGGSKSFLLALYAMLRLFLTQGSKVVLVGSAFRQSKVMFDYMETIWAGAPVLRDLCGQGRNRQNREQGPRRAVDRLEMNIGDSIGIAIPLGDGSRVRGQRATHVIADERASIPDEIFQNVVRGFAAVSASPVLNVKNSARVRLLKQLGMWKTEDDTIGIYKGNQVVEAGTAYYDFNHFCKKWKLYHAIIESRGDQRKLMEIFEGEIPKQFDWRDYSIIRLPYDLLPPDFMDEKMIAQARATTNKSIFIMEYSTCFSNDSDGFYRRTLIDSCVVGRDRPIVHAGQEVLFHAALQGDSHVQHVIAVDPASERDNFAVVVLALYPTHRRIVFCWTVRKTIYQLKKKKGLVKEQDFYEYCANKIRSLMRLFPTIRVAVDSQGGGVAVEQALHRTDKLLPGEMAIWRVPDPPEVAKPKDEDGFPGLHILEVINFASADWVNKANHGLRHDFETKTLLFPLWDPGSEVLARVDDRESGRVIIEGDEEITLYDTLEDCVVEIEQLKDELASIVVTQTPTGRDKWDTPKLLGAQGKAITLRKDRYTALLMANAVARELQATLPPTLPLATGGFVGGHLRGSKDSATTGQMYRGPEWFQNYANQAAPHYGVVVRK